MSTTQWAFSAEQTVALVTAPAAVVTAATTLVLGVRRRRQHERLIRETVSMLCAYQTGAGESPRQAHQDLARLLAVQDDQAKRLDRLVRPRVPAASPGRGPAASPSAGNPSATDSSAAPAVVEEIDSALLVLREAAAGLVAAPRPAALAPWPPGPAPPVPRPNDLPEFVEVLEAIRTTIRKQVRYVRVVLAHAERLAVLGTACRDTLDAALTAVADADREAGRLATAGEPAAAAALLATVEVPGGEEGVPGAAVRRDIDSQTIRLRAVATAHQAALVGWCRTARSRCGSPPDAPGPANRRRR